MRLLNLWTTWNDQFLSKSQHGLGHRAHSSSNMASLDCKRTSSRPSRPEEQTLQALSEKGISLKTTACGSCGMRDNSA